jgi:hypothetical protein
VVAKVDIVEAGVDASEPENHAPAHVPAMATANLTQRFIRSEYNWVAAKIGLNGLDPDLDQNKHRINLE